jgi:adenylate cyclase
LSTVGDIFEFDAFRLDRREGLSRRDECGDFVPVAVGPRALDVLAILLERAGRLVLKEDIMAAVWGRTVVENANLTVQISALRRILDRDRAEGSCIQTVAARGYRFIAPVARVEGAAGLASSVLRLPDKPSIAVLPFANLSGDPGQEYFADGMVEEIITALNRIRGLFVIARNSSFVYRNRAVDVTRVGRELGVRYVLEGSVRKGRGRVRISAQLIDAANGAHLWADRFDGALEDVLDLQDRVALGVAAVIEPALQAAEARRSAERLTTDLGAYDLYLRALAMVFPITRQGIAGALALLEEAIDRDYAPALSWAAFCHREIFVNGWAEMPETTRGKATDLARRALKATQNDPHVLANAALVLAEFGEDIDAMMALVDRALALNPSFARGWHLSAVLRHMAGQYDLVIEHVETSLRLNPLRTGTPLCLMGCAYFFQRRFDEAVSKLLLSIQDHPGFPPAYRLLAAAYAHLGRLDEARAAIEQLRPITSQIVPSELPYRNPEARELFLSGLRLAAGQPT